MSVPTYPKMADFDDLPGEFDPNQPDALWVLRDGPTPPKYFSVDTHEEAKDAVNLFYRYSGFAVSIHNVSKHTPSTKDLGKHVTSCKLRCGCGRSYTNKSRGERLHSSTKMTGCKWMACCKRRVDSETAEYGWSFEILVPHHNHNRAMGIGTFPQQRMRDEALKIRIKSMYEQNNTASKILNHLLATQSNLRLSDVKNELNKLVRDDLAGRSMIEALIDLLKTFEVAEGGGDGSKYWYKVDYDDMGHVRNLFWAHPDSYQMTKENPDIMQIDATYKVNKFDMPLLHTVGVTCHGTIYDVCFGFMGGEDWRHYGWHISAMHEFFEWLKVRPKCFVTDHDLALKAALKACYPNICQRRCIWHINQNVAAQARKAYDIRKAHTNEEKRELDDKRNDFIKRWHVLVSKPTEESFQEEWRSILRDYAEYPVLLLYLEKEQLPHFEEWAECFTQYFPDFGIKVTSGAKGAHYKVKIRLHFKGMSHLIHVVKNIHLMIVQQRHEHKIKNSADSARVPTDASNAEFNLLKRIISHKALRMLRDQLRLAKAHDFDENEACSSAFTHKWGLPCKHFLHYQITQLRARKKDPSAVYYVKLAQIDQHWFLDPPRAEGRQFEVDGDLFRPLDPLKVKAKGRPQGSTTKTLPKQPRRGNEVAYESREHSGWEHTQNEHEASCTATLASSAAPAAAPKRKRITKKKVITEEIIEEDMPEGPLNNATMNLFMEALQQQMGPMQAQIAALEKRLNCDIVDISNNSDDESKVAEEEERLSDGDFQSPKRVQGTQSSYGTRSKTSAPSQAKGRTKAAPKLAPKGKGRGKRGF
jgi:hypothetical protein